MHSWKKMKKKLTHFLSDHSPPPSPSSSSSSSSSSPSSTSSDHDQTRSPFKDDSYMSSMLSFFFPSNESISKKNEDYTEPTQSLKSIKCGTSKAWDPKEENGDQNSARSISSPEVFEDAIDLRTPKKYIPDQNLDSGSTVKHGISLRTLIRNSCDLPGPCLLITGDTKGAVFGGLLNSPLTPTPQRKYQAKGANRYFYMCLNDLLAFGGGGSFALRLDGDLLMGTSGPCDTFGNQHLAHSEEFELKNVELWGFTHSSRYRS
ncbi:TLDc [Cynara cardunculus var. scolymus]|uniref:TLDc n=1 Tax=Cynara cardunculus var. scolymus TaxID=59895 RepID=A0A103YFC3_CYNCS|nr:TLDc [Cynara cardunculus var. scolymus]